VILYVNGDSHASAAEAVVPHAWACDDGNLWGSGKEAHPLNDAVSFGRKLSEKLGWQYVNHSQSGGSNQRIIRTTKQWLDQQSNLDDIFVLIQWSTWEREEWLYKDEYYQVNASGTDHVPQPLQEKYKHYIIGIDWTTCTQQAHRDIWDFHCYLDQLGVRHLFFNANSHFGGLCLENNLMVPIIKHQQNWDKIYISPYDVDQTYNSILVKNGFKMVNPATYHFGADAHCFWADFVLQYLLDNKLISQDEISTN